MHKLKHVVTAALLLGAGAALAQAPAGPAYPAKTVRILVGFAPGGGIDVVARLYAQRLSESLGHQFVVENRPGAGGGIATDLVAKATPDGYTLLMASVTHAINATLYNKLPYDTLKDFTPISAVALQQDVIAVHPSVPVKSLGELVSMAKATPDKLSYAHAGNGTMMHVGMELFLSMAGVKMLAVPYNGSGPSTIAVLGGQVPVLSSSLPPALPHARAGKLRILAVTSAKRTPLAPEFPTIAEAAGLAGYEAVLWIGLLGPAGLPPAVVNRLNTEIGRLVQTREVREQLATQVISDAYHESPAAFAKLIQSDIAKWGKIVRQTGARVE
jgi:tripartite-type tricarboxylate transporter receptor subunit TctC